MISLADICLQANMCCAHRQFLFQWWIKGCNFSYSLICSFMVNRSMSQQTTVSFFRLHVTQKSFLIAILVFLLFHVSVFGRTSEILLRVINRFLPKMRVTNAGPVSLDTLKNLLYLKFLKISYVTHVTPCASF